MKRRAWKLTFQQRFGIPAELVIRRWDDLKPLLAKRQSQVLALWATHPEANAKTIANELGLTINTVCAVARSAAARIQSIRNCESRPARYQTVLQQLEMVEPSEHLVLSVLAKLNPETRRYLQAAIVEPAAKTQDLADQFRVSVTSVNQAKRKIAAVISEVRAGYDTHTEAGNE